MFVRQIQECLKHGVIADIKQIQALHQAFLNGNTESVAAGLTAIMGKMINVLDTKVRDVQKENFYHGLLLALLWSEPNWLILSNVESGEGFSDILIEPKDPDAGVVVEVKYAPPFVIWAKLA